MIATTVVLQLQDILLKSEGYEYFLTSRILQDCLENLFSVIRLRKPVPNAYDMKCALKLVCVSQFLYTPTTTSYDVDDGQFLVDLLSKGLQERAEAEAEAIDDDEIPFIEELSSVDCGILFHIGGFLLKGIMKEVGACEHCKTAVLGTSISEHSSLTALKEYVRDGNNLHYPLKYCEVYAEVL